MLRSSLIRTLLIGWIALIGAIAQPFGGADLWPSPLPVPQFVCYALDNNDVDADRNTPYGPTCWRIIDTDGVIGAVLTERDADKLVWQSDDYWMPTTADIAALEASLVDAAADAWMTEFDPGAVDSLEDGRHIRQYAGYVDDDGERKITVSGSCWITNDWWMSSVDQVLDGGTCFFYGTFNADHGEWESFEFHGEA